MLCSWPWRQKRPGAKESSASTIWKGIRPPEGSPLGGLAKVGTTSLVTRRGPGPASAAPPLYPHLPEELRPFIVFLAILTPSQESGFQWEEWGGASGLGKRPSGNLRADQGKVSTDRDITSSPPSSESMGVSDKQLTSVWPLCGQKNGTHE